MQIDAETAAVIGSLTGLGSALIGYGVMREKVSRAEKSIDKLEKDSVAYVTERHFETTIAPLERSIREIEKDIKKILILLSTHARNKD